MSNWNKDKPYNDLPTLPPKIELETKEVLKKVRVWHWKGCDKLSL